MSRIKSFRRGDTMVEVLISIAIFAFVAMMTMGVMTGGVAQGQTTLEITMARNAMDMQAETVRFWHEAASGGSLAATNSYVRNWQNLSSVDPLSSTNTISRAEYDAVIQQYRTNFIDQNIGCPTHSGAGTRGSLRINGYANETVMNKAFVVNSRDIVGTDVTDTIRRNVFTSNAPFPQLVYGTGGNLSTTNLVSTASGLTEAQGIFAFLVRERDSNPRYYNLHIHTCWKTSRLETTIRLTRPGL